MTGRFKGCIAEALQQAAEAGPEEQAALRAAADDYDEAYAAALEALSPDEADREAGRIAMDALAARAVREKQLRALSIRARRTIVEGVAAYKERRSYKGVAALGGKGGKPPKDGWIQGGEPPEQGPGSRGGAAARALELLIENKPGLAGSPFASVEGRYRAIRGQFDAQMADVIERFETRTGLDRPGRAVLENVVRELFGQETGDGAAKGLATAFAESAERARLMFNAAGGDIGKRDDWGLPQFHDPLAVREAGRDGWIAATLPRLAREKMTDRVTGRPFTERRLKAVLGEVYDSIASGGAVKREPGEALGRGMLANQRGEERFLVFKSADDWLAYQDAFGAGDPYGIMMGHLDEMARDIAQLQILGPNPDHQFEWLARWAMREAQIEEAAGKVGAVEKASASVRTARNMLAHFRGDANTPERAWLAEIGATGRAYLTGAALGSAILSDMPSAPVFGAMARSFSGLSKTGDMGRLTEAIASPTFRANARRSGFIIDQATDGIVRGAQDSLRLQTVGARVDGRGLNAFARRLPAAVFRVTGLTGWTAARKRTFRLEFMGALADRAGRTLADMRAGDAEDRAFAELLEARGFSERDWAAIGAAEAWEPASGARFLRPREIMESAGEDLGFRVAEMIEMQSRMAVPETTLWTRAKLLGADRPGTAWGEFKRSWAMFRSFTLTATHLYAEEVFLRGARAGNALGYSASVAGGLVGVLTLSGAISIQVREIAKGNDPRPMDAVAFWMAALTQGGGFGILGDFFYSAQSRAGKSSAMTGWGPGGAFLSDSWDLTGGNVGEVLEAVEAGEENPLDSARVGRDTVNWMRRYNPAASVWWLRTVLDRGVMDQLQRAVDPEAEKSFRARSQRLEREYGQTQFWPAGAAVPERAPDLANALGREE